LILNDVDLKSQAWIKITGHCEDEIARLQVVNEASGRSQTATEFTRGEIHALRGILQNGKVDKIVLSLVDGQLDDRPVY